MKRIFVTLVLISFLTVVVLPLPASAVTGPGTSCEMDTDMKDRIKDSLGLTCKISSGECKFADDDCAACCIFNTVYSVTDLIFVTLVAISGIMIMLGAFNLLFAAGETEKIAKGRNYIIYAAVGLAVGFLARAIPALVKTFGGF